MYMWPKNGYISSDVSLHQNAIWNRRFIRPVSFYILKLTFFHHCFRLISESQCSTGVLNSIKNFRACAACVYFALLGPVLGYPLDSTNERSIGFTVERRRIGPGMLYRKYALNDF